MATCQRCSRGVHRSDLSNWDGWLCCDSCIFRLVTGMVVMPPNPSPSEPEPEQEEVELVWTIESLGARRPEWEPPPMPTSTEPSPSKNSWRGIGIPERARTQEPEPEPPKPIEIGPPTFEPDGTLSPLEARDWAELARRVHAGLITEEEAVSIGAAWVAG